MGLHVPGSKIVDVGECPKQVPADQRSRSSQLNCGNQKGHTLWADPGKAKAKAAVRATFEGRGGSAVDKACSDQGEEEVEHG
jgi:hypothetical protein